MIIFVRSSWVFYFTIELGIADCDSHVRELFFFKIAIERRYGAIGGL